MTEERVYYLKSSNAFGGIIDVADFNTTLPNNKRIRSQVAANDLKDKLIQEKTRKNEEKKYKNMTLEELKEMKIISNTNGRPASTMTNEKWQKEITVRKLFIKPIDKSVTKLKSNFSKESGMWNEETQGIYHGTTNWQEYCSYVNDVLRNIRSGQVDYCYYIFQIIDLLKFHYDDLKTKYCDGYWEVWLEK